jgi:hypothetical protein
MGADVLMTGHTKAVQVFLTVLIFPTVIVPTVLIFPTEIKNRSYCFDIAN